MQQALDIFESYCEIWRLQVNVAKTKVPHTCEPYSKIGSIIELNIFSCKSIGIDSLRTSL
jgi:hypothetical protein